jgi:serine/threonine-protein kinase
MTREETVQLSEAEGARGLGGAPTALAPGAVLDGRYLLQAPLGAGGMGAVWRAENVRIGRPVAVKVMHPEVSANRHEVERFRREALIAVQLSSPHVVEVLDFGETRDGALYLVMELLEGESLRDRLRREERLPPDVVANLMRQLLRGLDAAHRAGVVHRDLKPENLFIVPRAGGGQLKILDFGIAKLSTPTPGAERTQSGLVMGTPQFLSPEQAVGGDVDGRADLYSAGVIAYLLLTGRHPFPTLDPRGLLRAHAYEAVPSPARDVPALADHPALLRFVARATEKDRNLRAQTAAELLDVLDGRSGVELARTPGASAPAPTPRATLLRPPVALLPGAVHATFLASEIVGFSALASERTREDLADLLAAHDRLVVPAIRAFRGRRVKVRGDASVATFRSPTNAVLCGMAIQDRLAAAGENALPLRIAIHLGEARLEAGDLIGPPLEVAAAALRGADPGDIRVTRAAYLALIRGEVRLEPLAPIEVAPGRMPLYRVERAAGALPYGGREAAHVAASERLTGALAPIAAIGDAAVEGRARAARRVGRAAVHLAALALADGAARAALAILAGARRCWRRRPAPVWMGRATVRLERARHALRVRRPAHRAALLRPLS